MDKVKVFITNFNRLTYPKAMAEYLAECDDVEPVIIDNNSDYPPLLEYYETCPFKVYRLKLNWGPLAWFYSGLVPIELGMVGGFCITDPDLDLSGVPKDFIHILKTGLDKYPTYDKCGLSLEINNLPESPIKAEVLQWETQNWGKALDEEGLYIPAAIDTTMAYYKSNIHSFNCLRTNRPYTAKHLDWYHTDRSKIPADELYYFERSHPQQNHWSKRVNEHIK
jgi:hypothetical protein